mgnify:CR=1 FL=1
MSEDRLIDIETKLAYQEDLLESLNQLVIKQQDRIDMLETVCRRLLDRTKDIKEPDEVGGDQYEIPPHY